ncbi:hypothetical protein COV23_01650 [Candidatus Wolfebacteria bacterium CG10_big_fil_rev_8_21_14_0_10_31_9]|uniref:Ribulose-phosphate 3-epimerase n=1 Tax=Candidatus Wolfebacteria bacterium CG10_big_fil_rev_8_21_14_0_10_31_9 TaxID=1975070 RepID=A0A2H0RE78_9BACT|nr:MAG: hypothetical protein COV23_01650 [Candidatus Wolfebacteria bacterium CG10_big_fil_rev_8_21_14_0_10_31_9]
MRIIPTVNCKNFKCVKERLENVAEFLHRGSWVQIDISDGKFTRVKTWNKPEQFKRLVNSNQKIGKIKFEIHLMVENPEVWVKKWLMAGADRVIVHAEAIDLKKFKIYDLEFKNKLGIAIKSNIKVEKLISYLDKIKFVLLLSVKAGYSGQKFDKKILEKIKFLKKNYPKIVIEVDGGVNPKIAKLIKKAGADIAVSGSYIFDSKNLKKAYDSLVV